MTVPATPGDGQQPDTDGGGSTLWHGRFDGGPAEALMAFTASLSFDRRLAQDDIEGSRAHVRGLYRVGLLDQDEQEAVLGALDTTARELESGDMKFVPSDEDIHTAIERRVVELAGAAGAKIHTGRSRNDQVSTAMRLWVKRSLGEVAQAVIGFQTVLINQAECHRDVYLPGYTHLQRAQPVMLAHHLAAHAWALSRDVDRLVDARTRMDVSPLGAAALAGSSLPLQPADTAADLGFASVFENSLDVTADRDFIAEMLFCLAMIGLHMSRIGEEVVLWTSEEFGFMTLDDAYATGSSMMPQKKNADIAELARGKSGRLVGNLTGLLVTLKGLPLAYNRDLQEDKEAVFDSFDQVMAALAALAGLFDTCRFHREAMATAADSDSSVATDLAELLVTGGTPFREAHGIVGALVRQSLASQTPLVEVAVAHELLGQAARPLFEPGAAARRRSTPGGAGPEPVAVQLERLRERIEVDGRRTRGS